MSTRRMNPAMLAAMGAALSLGGMGGAIVSEAAKFRAVMAALPRSAHHAHAVNGGQRRKTAIRAARLRHGGRCRFGKYR